MDCVNDPFINEVVFLASAQVGKTETLNNIIGYHIHNTPSRILYVCETETKAKAWSKEKLSPMIRDTPVLSKLINTKQRDANNEIEAKAFPGGHLAIGYATSPNSLSSRPVKILLLDEVEAFRATNEGDATAIAIKRTTTAGISRKIFLVSTPRNKETETLLTRYNESSAEKFFVPCPHCEEFQPLTWKDQDGNYNLLWDEDDYSTAFYVCNCCGCQLFEEDKEQMLAGGKWISTNPDYRGNRRGFWLNELYSPFTKWAEMAQMFAEAKNNVEKLKTFINTSLAEYWEDDGEKIDYQDLSFNREEYCAEVPDEVKVLTAGVDVQDDRIELEVVGWADDYESWSIDYKVIYGSPADKAVWQELRDYLLRDFETAEAENCLNIKAACIDSGGHHTDEVYAFCRANAGRRFFAIKGANIAGKPIISKPSMVGKPRVKLFTIGTESAKDTIFANLKTEEAGPGYCHFPDNEKYNDAYFKMLCAEKKVTKFVSGKAKSVYIKVSANARNEALDCRVYALAAVKILNPDFRTLDEKRYRKKIKPVPKVESVSKPRKFAMKGFINNWRK